MKGHPGGSEHTRHILDLAKLPLHAKVLDMGAGAGEAMSLLEALGFEAQGLDLVPRSDNIQYGDFLNTPFPDSSFDAVLSECAFFVSGSQSGALKEACRILRSDGLLLLSDVFFEDPAALLSNAGFELKYMEDMTPLWREYYLEALWREDEICCEIPQGKCSYYMVLSQKASPF